MAIPGPVIFVAILLAIPAQIYLSPGGSDMDFHLQQYLNKLKSFFDQFWYEPETDAPASLKRAEAVLVEDSVMDVGEVAKGYFGSSTIPRDPRPPFVKFRVGQVIVHKLNKYRGVIIGWDETEKAPEVWLREVRGVRSSRPADQPNYAILIDTRSRLVPQLGYVVQENLELSEGKVIHPLVDKYFERRTPDRSMYVKRPWLADIYPHD